MLGIGIAFDAILVRSRADSGAIAALTFRSCTVNLHQHRIVNITAECAFNRLDSNLAVVATIVLGFKLRPYEDRRRVVETKPAFQ